MRPKYNVGDVVFIAQAGPTETFVTCPDCCGKATLRVILGDETQLVIPCETCKHGFGGSTGRMQTYEYKANISKIAIEGMEFGGSEPTRYKYNMSGGGCNLGDESDVFPTEQAAQERADELCQTQAGEESARLLRKTKNAHTWARHVTYHRRQLKRAIEDTEHHEKMLGIAKEKAKTNDAN